MAPAPFLFDSKMVSGAFFSAIHPNKKATKAKMTHCINTMIQPSGNPELAELRGMVKIPAPIIVELHRMVTCNNDSFSALYIG
jgi:hypothetical protein